MEIKDPLPYLAIAKVYAQQGQFLAASLNAEKAVELDPTNADLYGQLGNIYKRGRNFETSIMALKCAVRGCTPAESCEARNGCLVGEVGVQVQAFVSIPTAPPTTWIMARSFQPSRPFTRNTAPKCSVC